MRTRLAVTGVAGVMLVVPLACGTPSAPSRTTAPRTTEAIPAAVTITTDGHPFTTTCWGGVVT